MEQAVTKHQFAKLTGRELPAISSAIYRRGVRPCGSDCQSYLYKLSDLQAAFTRKEPKLRYERLNLVDNRPANGVTIKEFIALNCPEMNYFTVDSKIRRSKSVRANGFVWKDSKKCLTYDLNQLKTLIGV